MAAPDPLIAVVLPPREGFGPGRTGAVGMIAQRLAAAPGPFRTLMLGGPPSRPSPPAGSTGATSIAATPPPSPARCARSPPR
jgi:hypothetical protein